MELSKYDISEEPVFVQLRDPESKNKLADDAGPVGVMVLGSDSEEFKRHSRKLINRSLQTMHKNKGLATTAEEIEEESRDTLAACISELVNISLDGRELKAPQDCVEFIKRMPWAAEQIDSAIGDRTLFMKALRKS